MAVIINKIKKIVLNIGKHLVRGLYIIGSYIIPVNDKIILFESSNGRNFTGNPKSIYEEILNQGLDN